MNKQQFLEKWGIRDFEDYKDVDLREELEKDLNEMLADRSTEAYSPEGKSTSVYIPGKEEEEGEEMNPGGWFRVISHT